MNEITMLLQEIEQGQSAKSEELLPLIYEELRRLAKARMANEKPGQTLQATALVHEAYVRLLGENGSTNWNSRGHFFAAAAEAMRRILIENARRKDRIKHGGQLDRIELSENLAASSQSSDDILALNEALEKLTEIDQQKADLVKLKLFTWAVHRRSRTSIGNPPRLSPPQMELLPRLVNCRVE